MKRFGFAALAVALGSLSLPLPSFTQTEAAKKHPIDAFEDACMDKHGSTQGMADCSRQAEAKWDAALNRDYKALLAKQDAKGRRVLQEAQRAWLAYRDKEWNLQADLYTKMEGSMRVNFAASAHKRVIKERALALHDYLHPFGEDL